MLNPDPPAIVTCEIVTLDPPVFVRVSESVFMTPTVTFPKATVDGLAVIGPDEPPLPDSAMVIVGFEPSDVILMLPLTAPGAVGWNDTLKLAL